MILAAIIGFGLGDTCLLKSIALIGVSRSYTIAYTSPLFTMVLATVLLGEPFLLQYLVGTVIIFFGIMLVSVNDNNEGPRKSYRELLAAFASALLWSIGMIFIAVGLEDVSVISANTIRFPFLFVFLFAVSRLWKRKLNLSRRNLALLGTSGILGMTLAGMTFLYSIQFIGVSRATPLSSSSPVWASLMSSIFLKEKLTWRVIASSIVVGAGRYLLT